jgi:hypothetical protein
MAFVMITKISYTLIVTRAMPAASSSPIHPVLDQLSGAVDHQRVGAGLLSVLAAVPDPRKRRGVRHRVTTILMVAVCAVMAGCRSFTAIGEWAAAASEQVRSALGIAYAVTSLTTAHELATWVRGHLVHQEPPALGA